ncbi:MAG: cistern family PEP-CTERM protein [Nitrosomonas sp.]|nr:cistern family PEP-CTERM protein [Nitrosomonas sp.]
MKNKLITSTLAGSALLLSLAYGHANAFLISTTGGSAGNPSGSLYKVTVSAADVGDSFSVNWLVPSGTGGLPVNLAASSIWTINSYTANSIQIGISITNDTDLSTQPTRNANIVSFGFGTVPNSTASLVTPGSVFDNVGAGQGAPQNFPGGFSAIDICLWPNNNCSGGNINLGLTPGSTDSIVLAAAPRSGVYGDSVDLLFFPLKFQTTWGSFEPAGVPTSGPSIQQIPEPGILTLIGIGLFGLGVLRRRRI